MPVRDVCAGADLAETGVADHAFKDMSQTRHNRLVFVVGLSVHDIDPIPDFIVAIFPACATTADQSTLKIGIGDDSSHGRVSSQGTLSTRDAIRRVLASPSNHQPDSAADLHNRGA